MKGFPDLPPLWWLGSIAVIYLGKWIAPGWHVTAPLFDLLAWVIFVAAIVVIAWSGIWFLRKRTPIEPHHQPKSLIVEGPYRLSRNPIYLALIMLTFGSAIGHGSVIGLLSAAVLWYILDRRFAAPEEALLRQSFGEAAEDYLKQTRRWL